ncbi:hypothetical protein VP95_27970 [Burkholderia pseudomallei]|nr:hypothetical protein VP95_27970 [Burkholderia pseudomallei]OND59023.1 hypothetical protein AQ936_14330 [Burkholderia pseudomallei]OND74130.1 hypothetical protein AQ940_16540 [Burkholderia pseudomallei]OND87231.1 hypothetical protein AQ939_15530 [Burkholderia pseudomallei]
MNTKDNGRTADDGRRKEGHDAALRRHGRAWRRNTAPKHGLGAPHRPRGTPAVPPPTHAA